jgi:hypothetical protein
LPNLIDRAPIDGDKRLNLKLAIAPLLLVGTAFGADIPLANLTFINANGQTLFRFEDDVEGRNS